LIKKPINLAQQENLTVQFNLNPLKKVKKPINLMIRFPSFSAAKLDSTESNWFGLNWNPVRFGLNFKKYELLGSVGFYC